MIRVICSKFLWSSPGSQKVESLATPPKPDDPSLLQPGSMKPLLSTGNLNIPERRSPRVSVLEELFRSSSLVAALVARKFVEQVKFFAFRTS